MIHQYRLNGYNIVLDVNSGSVHCVDDASYDIIRLFCAVKEGEGREVTEAGGREVTEAGGREVTETGGREVTEAGGREVTEAGGREVTEAEGREVTEGEGHEVTEADRQRITEEILCRYPEETPESIADVFDDIDELQRLGRLFSDDLFAPHPELLKPRKPYVKALCLHVAHTCNLNCSYCFASQGNFHGERAVMSAETARAALDFLVRESGSHYNLDVDFFGGEPLMNWDVVKETVRYGRELEKEHNKNIRFTLTTNGVGLSDEIIEFANREMHNVVLSLDGRKEVHDRFRRTINDQGSYDLIVPKFQRLVRARTGSCEADRTEYYMRGTYTHLNTDFTEDIKHMAELGFDQLSMEPVVTDPSDPLALTEEDLPLLYEQYEELAKWMLQREAEGRPVTFYHYMLDLEGGPCIYKRIAGCGAGTEYYAVTPWGDLYPCHQFVGEEVFRMGDIWNGIDAVKLQEEFGRNNIYAHEECADCWAKLYCSGGCAANAYHGTGSISGIYEYGCRLFRKRMECAIMMKVARAREGASSQVD